MDEIAPEQAFIEYMVKGIVEHPDDVLTERSVDDMGVLICLHVHRDDMGTIIGKEGRTAKALRTLLRVFGAKNNDRVNLKIIEPEGGRMSFGAEEGEGAMPAPASHIPSEDSDARLSEALKDIPMDELA